MQVKSPAKLRQVGVFLDVDEGQVSFYNVKSGSEIYSFSGTSEFTERMFPLLGTGDKEVPLVLMTTQHHLVWGTSRTRQRDKDGDKEEKQARNNRGGRKRAGLGHSWLLAAILDVDWTRPAHNLNLTTLFISPKWKHSAVCCCCQLSNTTICS